MKENAQAILNQFPKDVQEQIIDTFFAWENTYVTYEYGQYKVSTGFGIYKDYAPDHKFWAIKNTDIYTKDEAKALVDDYCKYSTWWSCRLTQAERLAILDKIHNGDDKADRKAWAEYKANHK